MKFDFHTLKAKLAINYQSYLIKTKSIVDRFMKN